MRNIEAYREGFGNFARRSGLALTGVAIAMASEGQVYGEGDSNTQEATHNAGVGVQVMPDRSKFIHSITVGGIARSTNEVNPISANIIYPEQNTVDSDGAVELKFIALDKDSQVEAEIRINGEKVDDDKLLCASGIMDREDGFEYTGLSCQTRLVLPNGEYKLEVVAENEEGEVVTDESEFKVEVPLSFISEGKKIADDNAFTEGLHFNKITDPKEFEEAFRRLHGEDVEVPVLEEGKTGIIAVQRSKDGMHALRFEGVRTDEKTGEVQVIMSLISAEPEFFPRTEGIVRGDYVLGVVDLPEDGFELYMKEMIIN